MLLAIAAPIFLDSHQPTTTSSLTHTKTRISVHTRENENRPAKWVWHEAAFSFFPFYIIHTLFIDFSECFAAALFLLVAHSSTNSSGDGGNNKKKTMRKHNFARFHAIWSSCPWLCVFDATVTDMCESIMWKIHNSDYFFLGHSAIVGVRWHKLLRFFSLWLLDGIMGHLADDDIFNLCQKKRKSKDSRVFAACK